MLTKRTLLALVFICAAFALIAQENTLPKRFKANEAALKQLSVELNFKWKADSTKAVLLGLPLIISDERNTYSFVQFRNRQPVYVGINTLDEINTYYGTQLWALPYLVAGTAQPTGMWEAFSGNAALPNPTDGNLQTNGIAPSRVFIINGGFVSGHANNVAWRMAGDGFLASNSGLGIAKEAEIYAWDVSNNLAELAANAGALLVSNHSYAEVRGWTSAIPITLGGVTKSINWWSESNVSKTEDYGFGFYTDDDQAMDNICYLAPYHSIVKAAGNDRGSNGSVPVTTFYTTDGINYVFDTYNTPVPEVDGGSDGYDCLPSSTTSKNAFIIGACANIVGGYTAPADVVPMYFSAFGPTDDGRLKPDFIAPGPGGTSYAAPNVSGAIALLQELNYKTHGVYLLSSTVKALLAHTACEAGPNPGPDYKHGWGLINPKGAADLILDNSGASQIIESSLANGETDYYYVYSNGTLPLVATLCWTDPEGTTVTRTYTATDLNNSTAMLVNDLDMRITDLGGSPVASPYVLNPALPANAATTGDNFRDNSEQIEHTSPVAGWYVIRVNHKGVLGATQNYSLVFSGLNNQSCASAAVPSVDNIWNGVSWSAPFVNGQNVLLAGNLTVAANQTFGHAFFAEDVEVSVASAVDLSITGNLYTAAGVAFTGDGTVNLSGASAQIWCGGGSATNVILNNAFGATLESTMLNISNMLTLTSGTLSTNGLLTLAATGGNYAQISDAGGAISGNITYQQVVSGASGWRHIASPVATNLADLLAETTDFNLALSGGSVYRWDATSGAWLNPANTSEAFGATNAYNVFFGTSGPNVFSALPHTISLTGTANTGAVNNTVVFGAATPISNNEQGWNMLPNPYPSNLDWNSVKANFGGLNISGSYYVWDSNSGVYKTHNGTVGDAVLGGNIAPGQAFFVRLLDVAAEATTAFDFTNANRTTAEAQFLKTQPPTLQLFATQNNSVDDYYVAFKEGFSLGLDAEEDAFKLFSPVNNVPQLYQQNAWEDFGLAINYVSDAFSEITIPLSYQNSAAGQAKIGIASSTLNPDWQVVLEDKKLDALQQINASPYTFLHEPQLDTARFLLHIYKKNEVDETPQLTLTTWAASGFLHLQLNQNLENATVAIYNLVGQRMYVGKFNMLVEASIPFTSKGVFLVVVTGQNGSVATGRLVN